MNAAPPPPDVTLLLRAHSEQRWLSREVIPVVRQLETGAHLPEDQLPAAIAYLEVIWAEAGGLAREADAALRGLDERDTSEADAALRGLDELDTCDARALRYAASVRALREAVARRVEALTAAPADYAGAADRGAADTLI